MLLLWRWKCGSWSNTSITICFTTKCSSEWYSLLYYFPPCCNSCQYCFCNSTCFVALWYGTWAALTTDIIESILELYLSLFHDESSRDQSAVKTFLRNPCELSGISLNPPKCIPVLFNHFLSTPLPPIFSISPFYWTTEVSPVCWMPKKSAWRSSKIMQTPGSGSSCKNGLSSF